MTGTCRLQHKKARSSTILGMRFLPLTQRLVSCLLLMGTGVCVTAHAQSPGMNIGVQALIHSAISAHPAMRAQNGLSKAAQSGVTGAKWQFWPTPSVSIEQANTSDPSYQGDSQVAILRLQQPLWTGGRLTNNLAKAEAQVLATQADVASTQQQLALRVVQLWSDAVAARHKLSAYRESRQIHARLLALVERRMDEGVSAKADVELARNRLDSVEAEIASAQAQFDTALSRIELLTQRSVTSEAFSRSDSGYPPEEVATPATLLTSARDMSPSIAKARALARIAEIDINLAKAALSPEIYLRAERQYGSFNLVNQSPQNRIFIGLSTAFGGGLSSLSSIERAQALNTAAMEDVQTQQLAVDEQVQGDTILLRTAQQRRQGLLRAKESAIEVYASWERQFLAGRKQWQDLMNAAREQSQTELQLADAIGAQHLASWRLAVLTKGVEGTLALPLRSLPMASSPEAVTQALSTKSVNSTVDANN